MFAIAGVQASDGSAVGNCSSSGCGESEGGECEEAETGAGDIFSPERKPTKSLKEEAS
jgi:hypothetical protein